MKLLNAKTIPDESMSCRFMFDVKAMLDAKTMFEAKTKMLYTTRL